MANASALDRVTASMTSTLDLATVLGEVTRGLVTELGAALARIWLLRDESTLRLAASAGLSERLDGSYAEVAVGALKIGGIAATRAPVCTNDLARDARIADPAWAAKNGLASFGGYPLVFRGELLGVLAVFAPRALGDDDFERLGAFAAHAAVAIKNAQLFDEVSKLSSRLQAENAYLEDKLRVVDPAVGIVGESAPLRAALGEIARVAKTDATVLLTGETGTGKELFARAVHEQSARRARPLVKVNCAALSPSLVESELFGHERGAFTGATQRRAGRFELADGGTLFLDEIGELGLDAQAKLLRVVQERELERVGGERPVRVDVRIVAATNRDLARDVKDGRFRADLFYRLNVFPVQVPPLRARKDDIPRLAAAFLAAIAASLGRARLAIDDDALEVLAAYDWPGNVRELRNVLERAAIVARGESIAVSDLPELAAAMVEAPAGEGASLKERVDALERQLIEEALRASNGNQSEAARRLRIHRASLVYKIKIHGLA
jgi:transcriptional regulator with GAF, ATPase, and Fis domain